jgi:hypothetical protein
MLSRNSLTFYNYSTIYNLRVLKVTHPKSESLKVGFNGSVKLEFHGSKVTGLSGPE